MRSESIEKEILDEDEDVAASMVPQKKARAVAKETCPKCGNPEMEYFTMQLRSADEGQTVLHRAKPAHRKGSQVDAPRRPKVHPVGAGRGMGKALGSTSSLRHL